MPLRLTITSYHKLTPGQVAEVELDRGKLAIGRAPDNDWVLPDPERLVSNHHCTIQFRDGIYYLTDTSTNGVLLVNSGMRLHKGNSEPLQDGERLRLGDYEVLVQLADQAMDSSLPQSEAFRSIDELIGREPAAGVELASPSREFSSAGRLGESPMGQQTRPDPFDFLAEPVVPPPPRPDHVPAEQSDFRAPRMSAPAASESSRPALIPADWDPFAELATPSAAEAAAVPVETSKTASSEPAAAGSDEVLEAFLRGAGVSQLHLDRAGAAAQMEAIGRSYRHMVAGLLEVLRARASLKGEFRMEQTMIRPLRNNPLKFSPNVDEALLQLLRPDNAAFMPADQAIRESFDDLKAHQLAIMAGVQAALRQLLKRFDPENLKTTLGDQAGLGGLLPGGRQAHYWELFTRLYATLSKEAEDDFQALFGREFSRAYEEYSTKLRKP